MTSVTQPELPKGASRHAPARASREPVPPAELARRIAEEAIVLGFAEVGFCPVSRFDEAARRLEAWLAHGYHGTLGYLEGAERRADPERLLASAKTLVVVALPHSNPLVALRREKDGAPLTGRIARYAQGQDYHLVLKSKLRRLADRVADLVARPVVARALVDTAPLLEREAAARAGIAFIAKNTMAIVPGVGSYVLLGELLLDVEVAVDRVPLAPRCGRCHACLDACPTGAFVDEHVLDARRCISYLTIELSGPIPRELRPLVGNWVFGCDVCQEVCPFNASSAPRPSAPELAPRAGLDAPELVRLLTLGAAQYRKLVRKSALRRVHRAELARNAAVALGNSRDPRAVEPLAHALQADRRPLVRSHAAWALGRIGGPVARAALERARDGDSDATVRQEARLGLADLDGAASTEA